RGFILITLPIRNYAALPVPDANRPESWVLEVVRRQLERFGFTTRDLGLIEAMFRAGHIALGLDGTDEADRDLALAGLSAARQTRVALALLIGADDEVAFAHLGARDAQILGRVELVQNQGVAVPADELLDQHRIALLIDDDIAAAGRRLERV